MDTAVFYVQWGEMVLIQALNQLHFVFSMECMVKYCFFCILFFLASLGASANQTFAVV